MQERREGRGGSKRESFEGGVCVRETRGVVYCAREFWKIIYKKFEHKPFSIFLHWVFGSIEIIFSLTSILQQNKHMQILKIFFEK